MSSPSRASVTLRTIDDENRDAVLALEVTPAQSHFVASVAQSFDDARDEPGACPWYRAIYVDETPAGFVMISDNIQPVRQGHGSAKSDLCAFPASGALF